MRKKNHKMKRGRGERKIINIKKNKSVTRIDPCGTPQMILSKAEFLFLVRDSLLSTREIILNDLSGRMILSLEFIMSWFKVSETLLRSRNIPRL